MFSSGSRSETLTARSGGRGRRGPAGQPEYRQAVRSILPLMQELAGYLGLGGDGGQDHNDRIYGTLSQALLTLAVAARAARMEQHRLLEDFHLLLEDLRFGAWSRQPELPGLIIDFLEFLEFLHRGGDAENSSTARRVRNKLRGLHLLSAMSGKAAQAVCPEASDAAVDEDIFATPLPEEGSVTRPGQADLLRHRPDDFEKLEVAMIKANSKPLAGFELYWLLSMSQVEFIFQEMRVMRASSGIAAAQYQDALLPVISLEEYYGLPASGPGRPLKYLVVRSVNDDNALVGLILQTPCILKIGQLQAAVAFPEQLSLPDNGGDILGIYFLSNRTLGIVPDLAGISGSLRRLAKEQR